MRRLFPERFQSKLCVWSTLNVNYFPRSRRSAGIYRTPVAHDTYRRWVGVVADVFFPRERSRPEQARYEEHKQPIDTRERFIRYGFYFFVVGTDFGAVVDDETARLSPRYIRSSGGASHRGKNRSLPSVFTRPKLPDRSSRGTAVYAIDQSKVKQCKNDG